MYGAVITERKVMNLRGRGTGEELEEQGTEVGMMSFVYGILKAIKKSIFIVGLVFFLF